MTKLERFLAFANFQPVDRVPCHCGYVDSLQKKMTEYLNGKDPYAYFDMDGGLGGGLRAPDGFKFPDYTSYHPDKIHGKDGFTIDGWGVGHQEHGFYHFTEYLSPLRNATRFEELEAYPVVSNETWLDDHLKESCKQAHAQGTYCSAWGGHMYEISWQIRGYEAFLLDLMDQRDWAEYLLDKCCANNYRTAVAAAKAGCDMVAFGDDVANQNSLMFSPQLWREVMKPRWAKVFAAARAIKKDIHIWYHSDGNISDILDELVEIGVTVLNPVQPECMDPVAIRKRFGKRLAFDGCLGTQTTLPFGSVEDVRRTVRGLVTDLDARNGGLMLSPTHVLEPEVPPANVVAMFDECRKM